MDDFDFSIRNERESLQPLHRDETDRITDSYSVAPMAVPAGAATNQGVEPGYLRHLIDQMQLNQQIQMANQMSWMMQRMQTQEVKSETSQSRFDGFSLTINKDVLRWVVLALFVIALIVILLQVRKQNQTLKRLVKRRKNPLKIRRKKEYHEPEVEFTLDDLEEIDEDDDE